MHAGLSSERVLFYMKQKHPKIWKCTKESTVADCKVFKVVKKHFEHPDGKSGDFYINMSSDWVQVAALVGGNSQSEPEVVLVNQFRFGVEKTSWEFPGGVAEKGESPIETAKRELLEETGYAGTRAKLLASYSPNPAIQNNRAHFVVIENCLKKSPVNWDANEEIEIKTVPVSKLDFLVSSGKIYHSIAINSIYFLQKYLAKKLKKTPAKTRAKLLNKTETLRYYFQ